MLLLSVTGLIDALARAIPKNVVRGIQLGLGLQLATLALKDYVPADGIPGYALYPWLGLFVPAKTPPEIVARINGEAARILNSPETRAKLVALGIDIATGTPQELDRVIRDDYERWGKVMREAGIKGE